MAGSGSSGRPCHIYFDWGAGTLGVLRKAIMNGPGAPVALTFRSLGERLPAALHAYTVVIVAVGRLLAPLRTWLLAPLLTLLAAASTWSGLAGPDIPVAAPGPPEIVGISARIPGQKCPR